jgi:hypothetical protein
VHQELAHPQGGSLALTADFLLTPQKLISFFLVCLTPMLLFLESQELNLRLKLQALGQLVSHMLKPCGFEDVTNSFIHYFQKFIPTILCIPMKLSFQKFRYLVVALSKLHRMDLHGQ